MSKVTFAKDTHKGQTRNYKGWFSSTVDNTDLQLINCNRLIYKDAGGMYHYNASSFDSEGNVYFTKEYISIDDNGFVRVIN